MTSLRETNQQPLGDDPSEETRFGGLSILFDHRVLRPRAWTAMQSEWAADLLRGGPAGPVLELCAGVGHIGLLAVIDSPRDLVQIDVNEAACEFARCNAAAAGLSSRVEVRHGRMEDVVRDAERFALIVADPPWVPSAQTHSFPEDPLIAIDGGDDGLAVILACLDVIGHHLDSAGCALLQLGTEAQVAAVDDHLLQRPDLGLQVQDFRSYEGGNTVALLSASGTSMTSLWLDRPDTIADEPIDPHEDLDTIVVGAGLTGLATALMLAQGGLRVAVLEARTVGAAATGNTTAKLSLLQGTKLSKLLRYKSRRVAQAYVDSNREGQQWLRQFCEEHIVPVQSRDAITYAPSVEDRGLVQRELDAALSLGLTVHWSDSLDVPFPCHGAVILPDQAQFDPMDVLIALTNELRRLGGTVHLDRRVIKASYGSRPGLTLQDGSTVHAEDIVLATGAPTLDRGLYFAKLEPQRSYALAFDHPEPPTGMYLSAGQPTRSVRDAPAQDGQARLLVGGAGHGVGRTPSERAHLDELRDWTARHFPDAVETHAWSAQDYGSHDGFPYVGKLPRGGGHVYVATGYDKWGMTNAVAAARNISAQVLDRDQPGWATTVGHRITRPQGVLHGAEINARTAVAAVRSMISAEAHPAPDEPAEGVGVVGRRGLVPTGVSTIDGSTCAVLAVCTHLGGALKWNDEARSWDCPLHGSRFAADGEVLEGPATRRLPPRQSDD